MLRPDSPTTTMKNSIAAAEVKLNDARARIKRGRNEHKRAHTSLRKETQTLHDRLTGSSGGDEKQRQKALQMSQDKQRAEETCISVDNLLSELDTIPEEELDEWNTHKTTHNTEKNSLLAARNEFNSGRTACKSELQSHQQDLAHAQKAIEKAKKYQTKLKDQTDSIDQAKRLGLSEKERKSNKQNAKDIERRGIEKNYADQFLYLAQGIHSEQIRAQAIWNNIAHVERQQQQAAQAEQAQQAAQQQAQQQARLLSLQQASGPLTPEGNLPGTNPPSSTTRSTFPFPFPSLGPSLGLPSSLDHSVSHVHSQSSQSHSQPSPRLPFISPNSLSASTNARARSSSMRSAYSAYMDFEDADPIPPMPGVTNDENMPFTGPPRNNSAGSGHNSSPGQQNSPINRQLGNGSPGLGMWGK
jgi:ubiquitination network signaling protein AcrB